MRDSIRLGRFAGIPVGIHWSLLVIAGLLTFDLAFGLLPEGGTAAAVVVAAATVVAFFASVLAHELAHSVVARRHGVEVRGITLWLLGGVARLDGEIPTARAELQIALAGPATSVGLAAGFAVLSVAFAALDAPVLVVGAIAYLAIVNGVLAVFNMIPAAPLDGGRVLAAALWAHSGDREKGTIGAARAGRVFGSLLIGFGVWGVITGGPQGLWPALLGWFVLGAAGAEEQQATIRRELRGMHVADAMTPASGLPGWLTVDGFIDALAERHVDASAPAFVVERWEGGVPGVVTLDALRAVPTVERAHTRVVELAVPVDELRTAGPNDDLAAVWGRPCARARLPHVVVFSQGHVVGVVTPEAIRYLAEIKTRARRGSSSPKRLLA